MSDFGYVVTNTSPLINLHKAGAIDAMIKLFTSNDLTIIIPSVVMEEIFDRTLSDKIRSLHKNGDVKITFLDEDKYTDCVRKVMTKIALESMNGSVFKPEEHETEAYVICYGKDIESEFVLLDEKAAIKVARGEGLKTMTHIDIIRKCVDDHIIKPSEGLSFLERLVAAGVKYKAGMIEHFRRIWR